ncbi:hypothetical protein, partial [Wolbachia pipientis]|uniref:hypothetical protein n=2 Tax=Wolbachia TaxID=953 RepID=UPI000586B21A
MLKNYPNKYSRGDACCLPFGVCDMPVVVNISEEECKRNSRYRCDNECIEHELEKKIKREVKNQISHKQKDNRCIGDYDEDGFNRKGYDR